MTDCVAVCLTLLEHFSKSDSCQATHLKSYLNRSAFTRLAGPCLDTKGCKKHLATYNLSTDCAKFPFKNCGSCLKAVVLIFKYPPQNVKMWVVFGRERVYSWLMHKQLINGQPEYIMNILEISLLADKRIWVVLNTNCPIVESLDEGKTKQESLKWRDGMFEAFQSSRQMHFPVQRTQTKDCLLSNWIWFKVLSSDLIFRWILNSKIIINCWCISPFKRKCFVFWMQRACVRCNLWRCAHCLITWD